MRLSLEMFKGFVSLLLLGHFIPDGALIADHHDKHSHHEHAHEGHGEDEVTEHGAHVHHQGEITLTAEGNQLKISLKGPGKDLIGTEKGTLDKASLEKKAKLENENWFTFKGTECSQKEIKLHIQSHSNTKAGHKENHGDVSVDYLYECVSPQKLTSIELLQRKGLPSLNQLRAQWIVFGHTGSHVFERKTEKTWVIELEK